MSIRPRALEPSAPATRGPARTRADRAELRNETFSGLGTTFVSPVTTSYTPVTTSTKPTT